jgi:glycine cleavage system protein P-like pyridoxal-binding family
MRLFKMPSLPHGGGFPKMAIVAIVAIVVMFLIALVASSMAR